MVVVVKYSLWDELKMSQAILSKDNFVPFSKLVRGLIDLNRFSKMAKIYYIIARNNRQD